MLRPRVLAAGGLLSLVAAAPVVASHVQPESVDGAQSCGPLSPGTVELVVAVPADAGSIAEGDFSVDVVLDGSVGTGSVSFSNATLPIEAALVAGPDGGNLYRYEEPVTEDDGLVAPDGMPIQQVSFCYVGEDGAADTDDAGTSPGDAATSEPQTGDDDAQASDDAAPPATDTAAPTPSAGTGLGPLLIGLGALSLAAGLGLRFAPHPLRTRRR